MFFPPSNMLGESENVEPTDTEDQLYPIGRKYKIWSLA